MAQKSQRLLLENLGGPTKIISVDEPIVEADDEVRVRIKAVALQPVDLKMMEYDLLGQGWPQSLGLDASGVVEDVGKAVTRFKAGDEVFGLFDGRVGKAAGYQDIAVIPENRLGKKPQHMSWEEAASLPIGYATALAAIGDVLGIPLSYISDKPNASSEFKPQSVLVLGGSSSVGASAIELLREALPNVEILTTASSKHENLLKKLGATRIFDRNANGKDIRDSSVEGSGVDAIIDCVNGAASNPAVLEALKPAGPKKLVEVFTGGNLKQIPDGLDHAFANAFAIWNWQTHMKGLEELTAKGRFVPPIEVKVAGSGLESIPKGWELLRQGVSGTKVAVTL